MIRMTLPPLDTQAHFGPLVPCPVRGGLSDAAPEPTRNADVNMTMLRERIQRVEREPPPTLRQIGRYMLQSLIPVLALQIAAEILAHYLA